MKDFSPLPTEYRPCVGIALFNQGGQIFLAQRRGYLAEYGWQMPQGGIDRGEAPYAAAVRELNEETSIPINQVRLLGRIDRWLTYDFDAQARMRGQMALKYRGQRQRWFAFELLGPDDLIDLETTEPEFDTWIWTDFQTAIDRAVDFKKEVYRQVADAFSIYAAPRA